MRSQLISKFGSTAVADQIIAAKEQDAEACKSQIRKNPDLHGLDTADSQSRKRLV